MSKVDDETYEQLKAFVAFYSSRYMNSDQLPPELRPMACVEMLEQKSRARALNSIRQAINDVIDRNRRTPYGEVEKMDAELRRQNVLTLSELRRRYSREYAKITTNRKIKNEAEYYLIKGIVDNSTEISATDRAVLCTMLVDFENMSIRKR